jgi:hypothetical protein
MKHPYAVHSARIPAAVKEVAQYYLWIPLAATSVLDLILAVTLCTYVKPNATYRKCAPPSDRQLTAMVDGRGGSMTSVMTSLVRFTFANGLATSFCSALGLITVRPFMSLPWSDDG